MTLEPFHLFEIILYSLISMSPYIFLTFYVFENRMRFSIGKTCFLQGLVLVIQVATRWIGITSEDFSSSMITLIRLASYFVFFLIAVQAHIGKKLFALLVTSNLSSLVSIGAHCLESLVLSSNSHPPFCWHTSLIILLLNCAITFPILYKLMGFAKPMIESNPVGNEWNYYWIIPLIFYFIWAYQIFNSPINAINIVQEPQTVIFLLIIHLSGLLVYYLVIQLSNQLRTNLELERRYHILSIEKITYQTLHERMEETRRSRHDLRHHVLVMSDYLANEEYDALREYLDSFQKTIPDTGNLLFCSNRAVNRLLLFFATQAQDNEIDFQVKLSIPSELAIPEEDISVLLGNLLENALDSCLEQKSFERKIFISGKGDEHSLFFTIDNTCENEVKKNSKGEYVSTKENGSGIGLQSVKHIVKRYNGVFTAEKKGEMFYTSFMLNL